jgi:hypothetical protein
MHHGLIHNLSDALAALVLDVIRALLGMKE